MLNSRVIVLAGLVSLAGCSPAPTQQTQQDVEAAPGAQLDSRTFRDCGDCPEMVRIPAGSFMMGSPDTELNRQIDEGPVHRVVFAKPFAISTFEIQMSEYRRFVESTGRHDTNNLDMQYSWRTVGRPNPPADSDPYPVNVGWQDARDYAAWLSKRTGRHYRLPTEAEWEYVARAGSNKASLESPELRHPAPGTESGDFGFLFPVTSFRANAFGVHSLTANMGEWMEDCYLDSYESAPSDGSAVEGTCKQRVSRGDSNYFHDVYERIANRDWKYTATGGDGIRLARDLP